MKLNSQDLEKITGLTLDYYNRHAEDFWEGTRNHDVSQNIAAMLQHIQGEPPFTIVRPPRPERGADPGSGMTPSIVDKSPKIVARFK
jgi:hypothetical protein